MGDTVSRKLDDLDPRLKPLVFELLARSVEAGIPVMIIDTLRTHEEHAANLAKGVSWVKHSKHLDGLAIDICPYSVFMIDGPDKLQWDVSAPQWTIIGESGQNDPYLSIVRRKVDRTKVRVNLYQMRPGGGRV